MVLCLLSLMIHLGFNCFFFLILCLLARIKQQNTEKRRSNSEAAFLHSSSLNDGRWQMFLSRECFCSKETLDDHLAAR